MSQYKFDVNTPTTVQGNPQTMRPMMSKIGGLNNDLINNL